MIAISKRNLNIIVYFSLFFCKYVKVEDLKLSQILSVYNHISFIIYHSQYLQIMEVNINVIFL